MRLAKYLDREGLTAKEFAARIGVARYTVQRYCRGELFPRAKMLAKILEVTGGRVRPDDFVET